MGEKGVTRVFNKRRFDFAMSVNTKNGILIAIRLQVYVTFELVGHDENQTKRAFDEKPPARK